MTIMLLLLCGGVTGIENCVTVTSGYIGGAGEYKVNRSSYRRCLAKVVESLLITTEQTMKNLPDRTWVNSSVVSVISLSFKNFHVQQIVTRVLDGRKILLERAMP